MSQTLLPKRRRGRQSAAAEQVYRDEVREFCEMILEVRSRRDFTRGSRGWCYLLEEHGLSKADFDRAQTLIGDCRKRGLLPIDIVAEDSNRESAGLQRVDYGSPLDYAEAIVAYVQEAHLDYTPHAFPGVAQEDRPQATVRADRRAVLHPLRQRARMGRHQH